MIVKPLPSSGEVKNGRSYICTPPYVFMTWYLVKRNSFIFTYLSH